MATIKGKGSNTTQDTGTQQALGRKATQFKPGQSDNPAGRRPKGSRNKVSEAFLTELYELWREQGSELIKRMAQKDPATIIRVTAQLVPKELQVSTAGDTFQEMLRRMEERARAEKAAKNEEACHAGEQAGER